MEIHRSPRFSPSFSRWKRRALLVSLLAATVTLSACRSEPQTPEQYWSELREDAASSNKEEKVARWLLEELLSPGGDPEQALKARKRLDELEATGMWAELGRGLQNWGHGRLHEAADAFFRAVVAANDSEDPEARLVAWFAAQHAYELSSHSPQFGKRHKPLIEQLLAQPKNLGFRAYATVVDLLVEEADASAEKEVEALLAQHLGCVAQIRLAGPFGTGHESEILQTFPAEAPGPWPQRFPAEEEQILTPHILQTSGQHCDVESKEARHGGIYYAESYLSLEQEEELILSAAGALKIWIDDHEVLDRNPSIWGVWPQFGVRLKLSPGRHRVLWKLNYPSTTLRVVRPDGRPLPVQGSTDPTAGYRLQAPKKGADPNELLRFIANGRVQPQADPVLRFLAAFLADFEGQADVASVLFEPLVQDPAQATGLALLSAASFVQNDPLYEDSQARDLVHELEVRAAERDPSLWLPQLRNALWLAEQKGATEAISHLEELSTRFPEVPGIQYTLAQLYEELDWEPEFDAIVRRIVQQFSTHPEALRLGIDLYEKEGNTERVDELLQKLVEEHPDTEVLLARALNRRDYEAAQAELQRLAARRPERKDIADRLVELFVRAGQEEKLLEKLERALEREPRDVHARLMLADMRYAAGEKTALAQALVEAIQSGAQAGLIEEAIDLVEGRTSLEPYRLQASEVIAEYERQGLHQPGTAARVLDYGALFIRSDGSSRFLEHEIIRIQSEEAIRQFAEMGAEGFLLHLRVLKKDGRILEPEAVEGKATVTMPHLEIGDYVEIERILSQYSDGKKKSYRGPTWFFQEENIAYARSEYVVISPANQELLIEAVHGVPEPEITREGSFIVRRYRVDQSPAAPSEPNSPPAREFLPHVSIGWGVDLESRLRSLSQQVTSLTAIDPRLVQIAENIVKPVGPDRPVERARKLYHWVLDHVQEGSENDGRRVVVSRNGNRWRGFETLCRALELPIQWGLAESSLSPALTGQLSSADRPLYPLLRLGTGKKAIWLTIEDRFAPFGSVPGHLRGQTAYLLEGGHVQKAQVPDTQVIDGITYEGTGMLSAQGSARLQLRIRFLGKYAASLRNGLSQIPESQLQTVIESRLLGQYLQGAQLEKYEVVDGDKLDRPLTLAVEVVVPQFASPSGSGLLFEPPFLPRFSPLTALAQRQTPLLLVDSNEQSLDLTLRLPEGWQTESREAQGSYGGSSYRVQDNSVEGSLRVQRQVVSQAARITPSDYPAFQKYTREVDAALSRAVRIRKTAQSKP